MTKYWKRTIVIYTNYNPEDVDIEDLAREALSGVGHYYYEDEEIDETEIDADLYNFCDQDELEYE